MNPISILKIGDFKDSNSNTQHISLDILEEITANFIEGTVPLIKGHCTDSPAMAWITKVFIDNGQLFAQFNQWNENFKTEILNNSFKNISASIFMPDSEANPTPGKYSLRHVAALGAVRPAIPNLGTLKEIFFPKKEEIIQFCLENQSQQEHTNIILNLQNQITILQQQLDEKNLFEELRSIIDQKLQHHSITAEKRIHLIELAKKLLKLGNTPEEAVMSFSEFFPQNPERISHRFDPYSLSNFHSSQVPWENTHAFADKVEQLLQEGMSRKEAFSQAIKNK